MAEIKTVADDDLIPNAIKSKGETLSGQWRRPGVV